AAHNYDRQTAMRKHVSKNREFRQKLIPTIIMSLITK
ncbi:unnamed protein product, partial [marine sediment metagenome]